MNLNNISLQDIQSSLDGEIEEILQNPANQQILIDSFEKSQLSDEEKSDFEKEYFGQVDKTREFYEENNIEQGPIEDVVMNLHEKYIRAQGKLQDLRDANRDNKSYIKDLKNEINALTKANYDLQGSDKDNKRIFDNQWGMIPPQNIEMEEQLLSTLMKHPAWMENFNQKYLNLMFYKEQHKKVHSAMINTQSRMTKTNVVAYLRKIEELEVVGGAYYVNQLSEVEGTEDPLILKTYIEQIEQHFLAREIIRFSDEMKREAYIGEAVVGKKWSYEKSSRSESGVKRKQEDKKERIDDFVEHIRNLSFRTLDLLPFRFRKYFNLSEGVKEVMKNTRDLIYRQGKPLISTGYSELDKVTHGVRQNKLYVVGARGKNGKTTFSVNVADNVMAQDKPVAFFSYEMTYEEILQKFIAKRANIDLEKFEYYDKDENPFSEEEQKRFDIAAKEVEDLPLRLRTGRPSSLDNLVAECQQIKAMNPDLALVVIDGLQAFERLVPERGNKSDYFTHVLGILKYDIAEELGLTVLLSAQLKADVERYAAKKPKSIKDFSDCKGIPDVADGGFLLYRPEHYFEDKSEFQGWLNVHPVELRNSGRKDKQFKLGIDIKYAKMYEFKEK